MAGTTYVSLSQATVLQRSLDVVAHNLANVNTVGYKAVRPLFASLVERTNGNNRGGVSFVQDKGNFVDPSQGALLQTGNSLDVALSGDGWFSYENKNGVRAYGRDGQLAVSADGALTTATGARILDDGGAPVSIPAEVGGNISIAADGTISSAKGEVLGQIGVFSLPSGADLNPIGGGLYVAPNGVTGKPMDAVDYKVSQGYVEQSNVQPILEMTRMIEIQRAYERSANLMSGGDDLSRQAIRRLGRAV